MNRIPVFNFAAWQQTAVDRWEAQATPSTVDGRLEYEAVCRVADDFSHWNWLLFQASALNPDSPLVLRAHGHAETLDAAQRSADRAARRWRDDTPTVPGVDNPHPYTEGSVVTCADCGTRHVLSALLLAGGSCRATDPDGDLCAGETFDGHHIDTLTGALGL